MSKTEESGQKFVDFSGAKAVHTSRGRTNYKQNGISLAAFVLPSFKIEKLSLFENETNFK